jgi:flavodoxin
MESKIYYFSGTGNSLYVASKLEEKLKLEKIKITNKTIELKEKENIILIAPTYAMGLPLITHRFLKINKEKINKVYFIATHAGMDGAIIKQVQ